jgi:hypothetical protein
VVGRPAEAREEDDPGESSGEQAGTEVVDRVMETCRVRMERDRDHTEGGHADGKVDVEDPTPREVVDEEPAEQRTDHG